MAKALYNKIQYIDDERITHLLIAIMHSGLLQKGNFRTKSTITPAEADINKGIALAKSNKPFNDTLAKFRRELGV